ncbi:MAG: DUF2520 domain-containing protein [Flavobacteriia bacterium]|nr:DUF2520 domain-containing protein [Flavobacteriia bacterium]
MGNTHLIILFLGMISMTIVGTGRLAKQLYILFKDRTDVQLQLVLGRSVERLQTFEGVPSSSDFSKNITSDIVVLAVSDHAIQSVSDQLNCPNSLVCHVSGSVPMSHLSAHKEHGVFYPLQTFGENSQIDFKYIPLLLEANTTKSMSALENLAILISDRVQAMDSQKRRELHLAAIWVNNFTNYLAGAAQDFCQSKTIDFSLLHPLLKQTLENIIKIGPSKAQTGPARRGDQQTIQAHLALLENAHDKNIYHSLSKAIAKKYAHEL